MLVLETEKIMDKSRKNNPLNRRGFLKSAAVGTAALVAKGPEGKAQQTQAGRGTAAPGRCDTTPTTDGATSPPAPHAPTRAGDPPATPT